MDHFPDTKESIKQLWWLSLFKLRYVIRHCFFYTLLLVLVKNLDLIVMRLPDWWYLKDVLHFILFIALLFVWAATLIQTDAVMRYRELNHVELFANLKNNTVNFLKGIFALLLFLVCLYSLGKGLSLLSARIWPENESLPAITFLLMAGVPTLVTLLLFFYALPILILEQERYLSSFAKSMSLIDHHWLHAFFPYSILLFIVVLVSPNTLHWHFLQAYHLTILFDLLVLSVMLPMFNIMVLLLLNDLRLRKIRK